MASLSLRNTVIPAGDGSNPAIFKKLRSEDYQGELELYSETLSKNNDDVKKKFCEAKLLSSLCWTQMGSPITPSPQLNH